MGNLSLCLCFYVKHEDYILIYENCQRTELNINKVPIYACSCSQSSKVPSDSFFKSIIKQKRKQERLSIKDFNILKMIGRGGFGRVLLVERKLNGNLYAMKVIQKNLLKYRNQEQHTKTERKILAEMKSPFIVELNSAFQDKKNLYFVMELMIGGELLFHLKKSGRFSESKAKFYAAEMVLALEYLHKHNIIYRDLKPENILLGEDGHIKLADFGLSKQLVSSEEKTFTMCGTADYLAPEIFLDFGNGPLAYDKSVDWWSLGIVIYEMLSGAPPFYCKEKQKMYKKFIETEIPLMSHFSPQVSSLLKSLLCIDSDLRLGALKDAEEIKAHPFFNTIDWNSLARKEVEPPYLPKIKNATDLSNFVKINIEKKDKTSYLLDNSKSRSNSNTSMKYSDFTFIYKDNSDDSIQKLENTVEFEDNTNFDLGL